ncbi:MAG: glycoside hydrolase family 28 protein [Clostridia bacterium]|nr:glycoside hydrolase family 28 protein [Clostridia bacterium]
MTLRLLYASCVSACFELDCETPYYACGAYKVFLNGEFVLENNTNVFSLFGLESGKKYEVRLEMGSFSAKAEFETKKETCACDVRAFGAAGDGVTDDTRAIQSAIHFLPDGARLHFPKGAYLTSPIALRSHITLEFASGASLLGSTDRKAYPILPGNVPDLSGGDDIMIGAFEGVMRPMYQSLIHASHAEDIAIVGAGVIDGNAQNSDFWTEFKNFQTARPRLLFFNNCKNVSVHGITARNSASWTFHPFYSENVSILDVQVEAPKYSPNTDAIDPESCQGVNIIGCRLSVGDDCIAIKSGKIDLARQRLKPAKDHVIRNCLMQFGHGAVTLGSETASGVKNLTVKKCIFNATDRGLRIKTRRGRGKDANISGITFENIKMDSVITPFVINMWYNCCDPDRYSDYVKCRLPLPVDDRTPHLGEFTFRNIECKNAHAAASYIDGLPESPIEKVTFENVSVFFCEDAKPFVPAMQNDAVERCKMGLYLNNVKTVVIKDTVVSGAQGDIAITENCENVITDNLREG